MKNPYNKLLSGYFLKDSLKYLDRELLALLPRISPFYPTLGKKGIRGSATSCPKLKSTECTKSHAMSEVHGVAIDSFSLAHEHDFNEKLSSKTCYANSVAVKGVYWGEKVGKTNKQKAHTEFQINLWVSAHVHFRKDGWTDIFQASCLE